MSSESLSRKSKEISIEIEMPLYKEEDQRIINEVRQIMDSALCAQIRNCRQERVEK